MNTRQELNKLVEKYDGGSAIHGRTLPSFPVFRIKSNSNAKFGNEMNK